MAFENQTNKRGKIILLSGPSGVGKGTIWKEFATKSNLEKYNIVLSISVTTRKKRANEINGENYYFVERDEFLKYIKEDLFLEYAEYAGNFYGTLKSVVEDNLKKGINVFLEIEVKGAKKILNTFKENEIISIFITPPSLEELFLRINTRHANTKEEIEKRLEIAKEEINEANNFKFKIVNDKLETCLKNFEDLLITNL